MTINLKNVITRDKKTLCKIVHAYYIFDLSKINTI